MSATLAAPQPRDRLGRFDEHELTGPDTGLGELFTTAQLREAIEADRAARGAFVIIDADGWATESSGVTVLTLDYLDREVQSDQDQAELVTRASDDLAALHALGQADCEHADTLRTFLASLVPTSALEDDERVEYATPTHLVSSCRGHSSFTATSLEDPNHTRVFDTFVAARNWVDAFS